MAVDAALPDPDGMKSTFVLVRFPWLYIYIDGRKNKGIVRENG
ncbi:MAG: hypothetical protein ACLT1W_10020 [Alistipes onderdonkii]